MAVVSQQTASMPRILIAGDQTVELPFTILLVDFPARVHHCVCKSPKHQQTGNLADGA
jgi:hypothetical protein